MSALIPATDGWRVCIWSREQDGVVPLPIIAWERETYTIKDYAGDEHDRVRLRPHVLSEYGEEVSPLRDDVWFVAIMPPGADLIDYMEAGEQVANAEREAEERAERKRLAAIAEEGTP